MSDCKVHYTTLEYDGGCYDCALETIDQLRAEYTAYRETALVEADLLRKDIKRLEIELGRAEQPTY